MHDIPNNITDKVLDNNSTEHGNLSHTRKINNSTLFVALLTLISRLLGFLRIGVLSALFGASGYADILNLVLSIPNNLRKLFAEGALTNSYMPSYASVVGVSDRATHKSYRLLFELLMWGGLATLVLVVLLSYFSESITTLLFDLHLPYQQELATEMFSWVIYYLWFVTISSMLAGMLQTHKHFITPALSPIIMSITTISTMVILHTQYYIFSVVYGYLLGGLLQIVVLAIPLFFFKYHIFNIKIMLGTFRRPMFSTEFKSILRRFPTISLAVILPIIGQQISFYFTSTLPEGSSSAFSYAIVFWQLPIGVIINSITSVAYTFLLTFIYQKNKLEAEICIQKAIEKLIVFLLPLSIMFYFFAHAGIAIALQRGEMTSNATLLTARVLQGYAFGLLPMGFFVLLQRILYAYQKNKLVFLYSFIFTVLDIGLSYILIHTHLKVIGLSVAYTIILAIVVPIMFIHINKKIIHFNVPFKRYIKIVLTMIPLAMASYLISLFTQEFWYLGSTIRNIICFILVSLVLLTILIIGYISLGINMRQILSSNKKG